MRYFSTNIDSPVGVLNLVANDKGLVAVMWGHTIPKQIKNVNPTAAKKEPILMETTKQLQEYFSGTRKKFDLEFVIEGTEFQKQVWCALLTIPYGQTYSYLEIAKSIGRPKAVRAVGTAIGNNPLSIVIPCHRVIGANGKLTGFGGGLENKALLLKLEKAPFN